LIGLSSGWYAFLNEKFYGSSGILPGMQPAFQEAE
jgi:hypothetical protein